MSNLNNDTITILGGTNPIVSCSNDDTSQACKESWNDFWEQDGISLTGNPFSSYSYDSYGLISPINSADTISFVMNDNVPDLPSAPTNDNGFWKYHEDVILKEVRDYLSGTYRSHYASAESKTQTLDLIESVGDAEPFCRSNAIKYLSRFGKKGGKSKQDILKAIHYCILLYHFAGLCNENKEPYETF